MKRILGVSAAIALAVVAGCTAGGTPSASPTGSPGATSTGAPEADVTLTFLTFETPNLTAAYWDDIIAKTSQAVPGVTIEKLVAPSAEQRNEYARQLDSTGALPDIMVAIDPPGLAEAGKLAEFSKEELADWVDPTANSFDGVIYQLPTNTQTWQIYYNKAAFQKAGITAPPATWSELLQAAKALQEAGIPPFLIGGGPDTLGPRWLFQPLVANEVYAKNPQWLSQLVAGDLNFGDPLFVNALNRLVELAPYASPAGLSQGYADAQASFLAGEAAMYSMGSWFPAAPSEAQQEEIGVFSVPTEDGSLVLPAYTGGGLSVSASAPDVAKAKAWAMEFSKLNADGGARYDGLFVSLKGYQPPADLPRLYNETFALYQKAQESGTVTPSFGSEGGVPALPSGMIAQVDAALLDLLTGRKTVDEVVTFLNGKLDELNR